MESDSDVHSGSRRAARLVLENLGLFKQQGRGTPTTEQLERALANVNLEGSKTPFFPSPWRVSESFSGGCIAMAALCALLEASRTSGVAPGPRDCTATIDVEQATWIALAQYSIEWQIEGGGMWFENTIKFYERLAEKMAKEKGDPPPAAAAEASSPAPATKPTTEELVDPPAGTPAISPIFNTIRAFLAETYKTKDRYIFLFPRVTDHPADWLKTLGFTPDQVKRLIQLGTTNAITHPTTYIRHHEEFLSALREQLEMQISTEVEKRINEMGAIAVVPRTREEFEQSEHGSIISRVPRVSLERVSSVRKSRSLEEFLAVASGRVSDEEPGLWSETGWNFGSVPKVLPTRGVLHGVKVLDITRIVAGPMVTLQLAQLGADVLRVSSADIFDYPPHDLGINLNKRCVELDLKSPSGKAKMRQLVTEADIVVNNLLFGSLDKLGFGFKDVLELVQDRPRGIIYVETNTFGFYGPLAALPGVEPLGQNMTGLSYHQGRFQPYTDPNLQMPSFTSVMLCDVTTGLNTAAGVLAALYKRSQIGGSYLVRGSLTQTALFVQDLGMYKDEEMVRRLWDGYPRHEVHLHADPSGYAHNGAVEYHIRMASWMKARGVRGGQWDSGFWMKTLDNPVGGSVVSFLPTLRLSLHSPEHEYLKFHSRQLRYDTHVGFLFDAEDPEGLEDGIGDLVKVGKRTYRVKTREEVTRQIDDFVARKKALKGSGAGVGVGAGVRL